MHEHSVVLRLEPRLRSDHRFSEHPLPIPVQTLWIGTWGWGSETPGAPKLGSLGQAQAYPGGLSWKSGLVFHILWFPVVLEASLRFLLCFVFLKHFAEET